MISAQDQGETVVTGSLFHNGGQAAAGLGDLGEITGMGIPGVARLGLHDLHVAEVFNAIGQTPEPLIQLGYADRTRTHVYASPAGSQVEGRADQCYTGRTHSFRISDLGCYHQRVRVGDLYGQGKAVFSFEFFPPKTDEAVNEL